MSMATSTTTATPSCESLRATLWREGAVTLPGFVSATELAELDAWLAVDDFDEAWWHCDVGRAIVGRIGAVCHELFGFHVLDPFRLEHSGGNAHTAAQVPLKSLWHRDNWPLTAAYRPDERFFHCRPVLFLSDVPDISFGPTEYLPGTHLRARWDERTPSKRGDAPGSVQMLGKAGDLWFMASRALHRRAFDEATADAGIGPKLRKVVWMVCKTEVPHP